MDGKRVASPISIAQLGRDGAGRMTAAGSPGAKTDANYTDYKVRVPRNLAKTYTMMRFQSGAKIDFSTVSKASMNRIVASSESKEGDAMPTYGAGSEYGRERREEARKKRRGYTKKTADPKSAPWALKVGGKGGKKYTGRKEAGINENSNYYILTQCPDGAFEAVPVNSWFNFTPNIHYHTLNAEEAEEEFNRRDKTVNFFSLMVKKRLNKEEGEGSEEGIDIKHSGLNQNMRIHDNDEDEASDDNEEEPDDEDKSDKGKNEKQTAQGQAGKQKGKGKGPSKPKRGSDDESDASSEEDGYFDSKEVDYMSDTSSSSEEEVNVETPKPVAKDDLNAETSESESEEDAELTNAGKDIKKMLEKDQGEGGSSEEEEEDQDPDGEEEKGASALFLQDKRKGKKKSGSRSSTESSSRSSTPTQAAEAGSSSTIAAAAKKLVEGRPGTPSKSKKRPASEPANKKGFHVISEGPAAKKLRASPLPSSGTNTPTPSEDGGQAITEESIRRYLARKPMTTKDLLQKFKTKRTGLTNEQTVQLIATILRKIQPEQKTIKGKMYLSLKSS